MLLRQSAGWLPKNEAQGMAYLLQALQLAQQAKSPRHLAQCCSRLAALNRSNGNPDLFLYDKLAVAYARQAGDSAVLFDALQLYATDLMNGNQPDVAWPFINEATSLADSLDRDKLRCLMALLKGFYYYKKFNPKQAAENFKSSLLLAQRLDDQKTVADSKRNLADCLVITGRLDSTLQLLFDAIQYYKDNNIAGDLGRANSSLAFAYQTNGNKAKAVALYQLAANLLHKAGLPLERAHAELSLARQLWLLKQFDTAKAYIQKAEATFSNAHNLAGQALAKNFWGQFHAALGDAEKARACFQESMELNKKLKSPLLAMANKSYAAVNAALSGNQQEADSLLNSTIKQMRDMLPPELVANAFARSKGNNPDRDSEDYAATKAFFAGKAPAAFSFDTAALRLDHDIGDDTAHSRVLHKYYDSLLQAIETRNNTREMRDSITLQHQKIRIAQQQVIIAQQQITNRNRALAAASVVLVLLSVIGWQQARRRKQAELEKKKAEADQKRTEATRKVIENLVIATRHNTKNYFQHILNTMSRSKREQHAETTLQHLQLRLNAVLSLQQFLYKEDEAFVTGKESPVEMKDYLQAICDNLRIFFGSGKPVSTVVQAPVQLTSSAALLIAEIVNELVTNSFKYAFRGRDAGEIRVRMQQDNTGLCRLRVSDNGIGLPPHARRSKGLNLIEGFCHELGGRFAFSTAHGTAFTLEFVPFVKTKADAEA